MAADKKYKLTIDGVETQVVPVGIKKQTEEFNYYTLDDGTRLKLKVIVMDVLRIEGQKDEFGNPRYLVRSNNVLAVEK